MSVFLESSPADWVASNDHAFAIREAQPLATGGPDDPFSRLFESATDIAIVAAFVQGSGLRQIEPSVHAALARGARCWVLTGD